MSKDPRRDGDEIINMDNVPKDPAQAGFVGKRRATFGSIPVPNGNRAERRAYAAYLRRGKVKGL